MSKSWKLKQTNLFDKEPANIAIAMELLEQFEKVFWTFRPSKFEDQLDRCPQIESSFLKSNFLNVPNADTLRYKG